MTLYPGVEYTREIKRPEYLTLAALDCRPQMNRGETNLTAYLVLKCDNYEHVLCTLVQGHAHQQILNFVMQEGEKMTLTVEGSGIVHVTGYTFKQLVLSDDTDTRTETTLMREVSDGIQDGEVLSPLPSSEGDDCTIIGMLTFNSEKFVKSNNPRSYFISKPTCKSEINICIVILTVCIKAV
ncbi:FK506-binding protein 4 [Holothuria leucospilota]|uniref:FK506-binding protein 4 n=1 Tax=Holothuria leucospilota TaxID=206669 RepID=A0A9Q1BS10_HOLLE|nr:FK506-binding protein 4 [Holothuria leucospilota]